jgi:hypothetical protein
MKFSLKPVFIGWITLLAQLPLQLFFTLWCGGFFGGLARSFGNVSASGVGVRDIFNPDDAYEKIKGMVETHNV